MNKSFLRHVVDTRRMGSSNPKIPSYSSILAARNRTPDIKSLDTPGYDTSIKKQLVYTGDNILGVATMHKSNAVPIFTEQDAKDVSSMRR